MNKVKGLFFIPEHLREEIEGDLLQRFERDVKRDGPRIARAKLIFSIIKFFRPGILFRKSPYKKSYYPGMFKNYFVIAIRNVMAHKTNSVINILSLIVGITSALILISVIRYELSFDSYHSNADRIYRIFRQDKAGFDFRAAGVAYPIADVFREEVTSIENITGVQFYGGAQIDIELNGESRRFHEDASVAIVDQQFLKIFDFHGTGSKWISGNFDKALTEPFSVVLTESLAKKYFGSADPIGKPIRLERQLDAKVTGLISDLPANSDLPFNMLVSYSTLYLIQGDEMKDDFRSVNSSHEAFVLLPENTPVEVVETQFDKVHAAHADKDLSESLKYRLQPLSLMHRDPLLNNFRGRTADETALWIMALTGLLLLLVGCINYINIATAQYTLRGREIGVRKVLGGQRKQLILQLLSETFVLVGLACIASLVLAEIILMNTSGLTNTKLLTHLFADPFIISLLAGLVITITLVAGLYPAAVVSSYNIIGALKGFSSGGGFTRKILVIVQFAVTQAFLIAAFIVINQLRYSRTLDLGFDKDLIINVSVPDASTTKSEMLRDKVIAVPSVSSISLSSTFPGGQARSHWFTSIRKRETPKEQQVGVEYQSVDTAYFHVYGISIVAGRNFLSSDSAGASIINEALVRKLDFKTNEDAIGQPVVIDGKEYSVVGVVKDFHNQSTRDQIGEMAFINRPGFFITSSIKLNTNPEMLPEAVLELEKVWATVYPDMAFNYDFFDENIENYYRQEEKLSSVLQIFSGVFLMIACLGLYGLLSFVINRRMKEVAVRKVFGAGVTDIVNLISKDYVILILISFAIAAPSSFYFMNQWLEEYPYHVPITWWILVTPGIVALAIAMITLSGKLLRAAAKNPAETLKYE